MDIEEFKRIVENVSEEYPAWFALEPDKIPTVQDVEEAEKSIGVEFPKEYKEFLINYGGGYFGFSTVYSLDPESDFNLKEKNDEIASKFKSGPGYLVFSDNGCGDYYAFQIELGKCSSRIQWFDHEQEKWSETTYNGLFEFLVRQALTR